MTIAEKLRLIANNVQKVFDGGKKAEYDAFWDIYQQNGKRIQYAYAFGSVGWTDETFKPKYDMDVKGANYMFGGTGITNLSEALRKNGKKLITGYDASYYAMFSGANSITDIPELDFSMTTATQSVFANCTALKSIEKIKMGDRNTNVSSMFQNCTALENVIFEGTLACSGLDVRACTKLTVESLRSILKVLSKNVSGKSITFATVHQATIESDTECIEYATAAKNAGWTIAYNP